MRAVELQTQLARAAEAQAIEKAWRLGPTLAIAEALLRSERVPHAALDPVWRRRYGL
jgi:hypothetical protein